MGRVAVEVIWQTGGMPLPSPPGGMPLPSPPGIRLLADPLRMSRRPSGVLANVGDVSVVIVFVGQRDVRFREAVLNRGDAVGSSFFTIVDCALSDN